MNPARISIQLEIIECGIRTMPETATVKKKGTEAKQQRFGATLNGGSIASESKAYATASECRELKSHEICPFERMKGQNYPSPKETLLFSNGSQHSHFLCEP